MSENSLHPATCPECCKRAVTGSRHEELQDVITDVAYAAREIACIAIRDALLLCATLAILIPTLFNAHQRKLSHRQWQEIKSTADKQKSIALEEHNLECTKKMLLDDMFDHKPTRQEYLLLDAYNHQLDCMDYDWHDLDKVRIELVHRGSSMQDFS